MVTSESPQSVSNNLPNIILLVIDALRPKDLSLYGCKQESDKNIKQIASESIVFQKNFSTSCASTVSMNSIFSGQYPTTSGFLHQHPRTTKEELDKLRKIKFWLTLCLKNKGYSTISVTPQFMWFKKGFDYYKNQEGKGFGKYLNNSFIKKIMLGLPSWFYQLGKKLFKTRASNPFESSKQLVDMSINLIKKTSKPFFMYMQPVDVHSPYAAVKTKNILGNTTLKKILEHIESSTQKEYIKKRFFDISINSLEQLEQKVSDSIKSVDRQIGRLYKFLKKEKLWDNTIFIITSDHGDNFGEHNTYFCRGGLYDTSIHVPLIMHLPKLQPKTISELTSSIDISPTILDFIGEKKKNIDGKSLLSLIKHNSKFRDKIYAVDGFCENRIAVRTKNRKVIISKNGKCYLCGAEHSKEKEEYDLQIDPLELKNIYSDKNELEKFLNDL